MVGHHILPLSLAWEAFGEKNGTPDQPALLRAIGRYRRDQHPDPVIGCTLLTEPFFLPPEEWIPQPADWHRNLVTGKTYSTDTESGSRLWSEVLSRMARLPSAASTAAHAGETSAGYGSEYLTRAYRNYVLRGVIGFFGELDRRHIASAGNVSSRVSPNTRENLRNTSEPATQAWDR